MELKKQKQIWTIGGITFLIIGLMRFQGSSFWGIVNIIVSILFFLNVYKINKQIKK